LANITVPLVGLVDTAVAGHLHSTAGTSAEFIGGISVGALILNVFYWNFAFLRASTGGLTAQAYGRGEGYMPILRRGLKLALGISALLLLLGWRCSKGLPVPRESPPGRPSIF
jgi:MATE family multidrug resistance protein